MTRWAGVPGVSGEAYQERFDQLAAAGQHVHGEADLCSRVVSPGARVLDAGCGTGRVAIELGRRGYQVTGTDIDLRMLRKARDLAPEIAWVEADLAVLTGEFLAAQGVHEPFDLVVAAGNVLPLVAPGTEAQVVANLAGTLSADGLLVAGFGLDAQHLPLADAPFGLAEYDAWCAAAGLRLTARHATWDGDPYDGGGYAVSIHTRG
jgi:SAM-dependent methyltransferase